MLGEEESSARDEASDRVRSGDELCKLCEVLDFRGLCDRVRDSRQTLQGGMTLSLLPLFTSRSGM